MIYKSKFFEQYDTLKVRFNDFHDSNSKIWKSMHTIFFVLN